jgi:hypothetical protein
MTVAIPQRASISRYEPQSLEELIRYAEILAKSDGVPKCYRGQPSTIVYAIQIGAGLGLDAAQSIQSIANIDGQLRMWGDSPLGIVRASGLLEKFSEVGHFPEPDEDGTEHYKEWVATCTLTRRGEPEQIVEYTYDDAVRAGLWMRKSREGGAMPWSSSPKRMMKYRARGFALRDNFPDVLKGIAIAEEFDEPRNVTAQAPGLDGDRTGQLKEHLGGMMGATAIRPEVVVGIVEPPAPNFRAMLDSEIRDALERAGFDRGIPQAEYKTIGLAALAGKKLTKTTALLVWRAIQAWEAPHVPTEIEAADLGRPADDAVCTECGGNGYDGGVEASEAPCGMCGGSGKMPADEPELPL